MTIIDIGNQWVRININTETREKRELESMLDTLIEVVEELNDAINNK